MLCLQCKSSSFKAHTGKHISSSRAPCCSAPGSKARVIRAFNMYDRTQRLMRQALMRSRENVRAVPSSGTHSRASSAPPTTRSDSYSTRHVCSDHILHAAHNSDPSPWRARCAAFETCTSSSWTGTTDAVYGSMQPPLVSRRSLNM